MSSSRAWTGTFLEKSNLTPESVHGLAVSFSTASDEIININQHLAFRRVFCLRTMCRNICHTDCDRRDWKRAAAFRIASTANMSEDPVRPRGQPEQASCARDRWSCYDRKTQKRL